MFGTCKRKIRHFREIEARTVLVCFKLKCKIKLEVSLNIVDLKKAIRKLIIKDS